jgi:uncharacterized protein YigA (DUF484 family)
MIAEERTVVEFLRNHPEFFQSHAGLLADLTIPHSTGGAVSLIERQVSALRDQNRELKRQLNALIQVARDNDRLNGNMQRMTLSLMEAQDLKKVLSAIHDDLQADFRADAVSLRLFRNSLLSPHDIDIDVMDIAWISREGDCASAYAAMLSTGKPLCGHLRRVQLHCLFGEHQSADIGSAVVLPLYYAGNPRDEKRSSFGLIGIGSRDPHRYHPGMGTMFITHLGEMMGRAIWTHLATA